MFTKRYVISESIIDRISAQAYQGIHLKVSHNVALKSGDLQIFK